MLLTTLFLTLLACHINSEFEFIVDSKSPIVIHDESYGGGGDPRTSNSFFGYSLAFIPGVFGEGGSQAFGGQRNSAHGTLFIGAPTEKQYTKNSGVIWGCQFSENVRIECSPHLKLSDAAPITKSSWRNQKPTEYPEPEQEQWIGAMFGGCYQTTSVNSDPTLLSPLNEPGRFYYGSTDSTGQRIDEYWYMYAEYGFSSHATRSDSLLVGAPCGRKWTGIYVEHKKENPRFPHVRNTPIIHNRDGNILGEEAHAHSLLGYAITSGRIQGRGEYVAVGAPRAKDLSGVVLITSSQTLSLKFITGNQLGSYFGYAMATADLDGDGDDELIVGAPMQTDYNSREGYSSGCVYLYDIDAALQYRLLFTLYVPKTSNYLVEARGARFGSAVVNLGDINNDRKDDFAISAPYHDSGVGTVFIYYGGRSSQFPVQTIKGKSLEIPSLYGFGTYLLAGKLDVDGNTTPDLAVASFESNHAIVFRTRPVAQATVRVTYHMVEENEEEIVKFLPTQNQLLVKVCVKFQFSIALTRENILDTWIKFEPDRNEKRFEFDDGKGSEYNQPLSSIEERCLPRRLKLKEGVRVENNLEPIRFRAGLWYNATQPLASQTVKPITIVLPQHQQPQGQATNEFNPFLPSPISYKEFESVLAIASDDCESDGNKNCDPDLKLKLDVHYEDENKKQKSLYTNQKLMVGKLETLILTITLSNKRETAYRPTLKLTLKFSEDFEIPHISKTDWRWVVTYSSGKVNQFETKPNTKLNNSIVTDILPLSQSLQREQSTIYELRVGNLKQMKVKDSLNGKLTVIVEAYPESQQQREKVIEGPLEIPLEAKFHIDIQALTWKMNDINTRNNRVVDLAQFYTLENTGFSSSAMDSVKIELVVPTHAHIDNNLTQILGVVNPAQTKMQCTAVDFEFYNPGIENSRKGASLEPTSSSNAPQSLSNGRSKRATKASQGAGGTREPTRLTISSSDNLIRLPGCDKPSTYCRKIICFTDMPSLRKKTIKLHMYLLENAFRELINDEITGISIESSISVSYLKTTEKKKGVVMRMFLLDKGIAAWKLLVAGAGGTILFLLLTFALFKCGFFRRKTKEQLQTLKRQTQLLLPADGTDPTMSEDEDAQHENTHF
ncbi:unnamed protein product [Orchesella dallaii]|uniref:Integrin alpha second immunoglobulin-like domain-containing protein n=1 Tax=Orchesella dallaii TaxID=48710 RepID=A0ABP1Q3S8_9HEXA